jgi:hypothetical protein
VQVTLYEKQLSYRVRVVQHTYHSAPQATLDAGVQGAALQALTFFCQELRDLDNQQLREKEYMQKIVDLQAWERVHERKIQELQALNYTLEAIIQSLDDNYEKFGKMEMMT